jgi:hypothetical protein
MSDECATVERTRRRAALHRIVAAAMSVSLLVAAIVAPSPAIVVVLFASAVATGVVVANSVPRAFLALRAHRHRRGLHDPIRPKARRALAEFRRDLDSLPETTHPIGL